MDIELPSWELQGAKGVVAKEALKKKLAYRFLWLDILEEVVGF